MKKRIRPANEEIGPVALLLLFPVLWYGMLLKTITVNGFQPFLLIFLAAGLLPVLTAINQVRRALFYRKQREEAIALGHVQTGRIKGMVRKDIPYQTGKNQQLRYRRSYCLQVELMDPVTGVTHMIESEGYRIPIHRYLASDRVKVYTDRSGWKYYLEEFQLKTHKKDPGIFGQTPLEYEETLTGNGRVVQIIFLVIIVMMILGFFF